MFMAVATAIAVVTPITVGMVRLVVDNVLAPELGYRAVLILLAEMFTLSSLVVKVSITFDVVLVLFSSEIFLDVCRRLLLILEVAVTLDNESLFCNGIFDALVGLAFVNLSAALFATFLMF